MRFEYFLFDLDNCLLQIPNPGEYFDKILISTLKRLSAKIIPVREDRKNFWSSGDNYIDLLKNWKISDINNFWLHFDEIDFKNRKLLTEKKELNLYLDVKDVLEKLSNEPNNKLAIISNTADYIVEYILTHFSIKQFFHESFSLGSDKNQALAKPSPSGILQVLDKLNYDSKRYNAIMVGDSMLDIIAAKRANIKACLIKRDLNKYPDGINHWESQPDYVIFQLDELFNL